MAHSGADVPWHALGCPGGIVQSMEVAEFGSYGDAHTRADIGRGKKARRMRFESVADDLGRVPQRTPEKKNRRRAGPQARRRPRLRRARVADTGRRVDAHLRQNRPHRRHPRGHHPVHAPWLPRHLGEPRKGAFSGLRARAHSPKRPDVAACGGLWPVPLNGLADRWRGHLRLRQRCEPCTRANEQGRKRTSTNHSLTIF